MSIAHTKTICVFCGSSSGNDDSVTKAADKLGELFVQNQWGLVYGGGTTGIMGTVARAVATRGGYVNGIIPEALIHKEQNKINPPTVEEYGQTTVVQDMHTRKRLMGQEADAFVALPGGYGTAEELFEVITWNQLGIHSCPIVLFNINGFYDGLIEWINKAVEQGFIGNGARDIVVVGETAEEVIEKIKEYKVAEGRFTLDWGDQGPKKCDH